MSAETLSAQAQSAYQNGDYQLAADLFGRAAACFAATGDAINEAEMNNNASVALFKLGNASAAYEKARGTDLLFEQRGKTREQALSLGNQAAALEGLHRFAEAEQKYQTCIILFEQAGEQELLSITCKTLSALQLRRGKIFDAMVTMQAGLRVKKKLNLRERLLLFLLKIPPRLLR